MSKPVRNPGQMELRIFGGIRGGKSKEGAGRVVEQGPSRSPTKVAGEATERDKSVYASIAKQYFRSLD